MATFNRLITLNTAVTELMGSMGLPIPTDVTSSVDKTVIQMRYLVNRVGEELMNENEWQILDKEMVIVTDGVTLTYPLPDDFGRFYDDAAWNQTTRLPALGALTQQEWAQIKARNLGGTTFAMLYTIQNDTLTFYSVGTTPQTLVFPYVSRGWVRSAAGVLQDRALLNDDVILYDPTLFKAVLKRAWLMDKGFDSTAADLAYRTALAAAIGKEAPARTLSLRTTGYPYLSIDNAPITGYGS